MAISLLPPARVLDVACGPGLMTRYLGQEVTGLDQSEAMLEIARERVPRADFIRGEALQMPFRDGAFDRVFASFFYGLLAPGDKERFLSEARRVAGEVTLVEPTPEWEPEGRREVWEERSLDEDLGTRSTAGTSQPRRSPKNSTATSSSRDDGSLWPPLRLVYASALAVNFPAQWRSSLRATSFRPMR